MVHVDKIPTDTTPTDKTPCDAAADGDASRPPVRARAVATTTASPATLWTRLADARGWSSWSSFDRSELLETGQDGGDGLGALRRFQYKKNVSVERVVAFEANRHLGYTLVSGLPLRRYRADVTLVPRAGGGTEITWESRFDGPIPGTGRIYGFALQRFLARLVRELVADAEQSEATTRPSATTLNARSSQPA